MNKHSDTNEWSAFTSEVPSPRFYDLVSRLIRPLIEMRGGLSVSGQENLIYNDQGQIFTANHKSNWDPIYMGAMGSMFNLRLFNLAKDELFKTKTISKVIANLGGIPFDRSTDLMLQPAGRHFGAVIEAGGSAVLYPEGHRYKGEELGLMKRVGGFALRKNAIVYPTAIAGTNQKVGHVHIRIGQPFNVNEANLQTATPRRRRDVVREIDDQLPLRIEELYLQARDRLTTTA
jgi:1-acyl-sn-glycerol-3-phosphate acyltransferase